MFLTASWLKGRNVCSKEHIYDLHEALLAKNGPTFWKYWRSKFEIRPGCTEVDGFVEPDVIANKVDVLHVRLTDLHAAHQNLPFPPDRTLPLKQYQYQGRL